MFSNTLYGMIKFLYLLQTKLFSSVVIIGVLYLVLGLLYQRFIVGAKGMEQIPNYLMWKEFGTLQAVSTVMCSLVHQGFLLGIKNVHVLIVQPKNRY